MENLKLGGNGKFLLLRWFFLCGVRIGEGENLCWFLWRSVLLEGLGNGFFRWGDFELFDFDKMGDVGFFFDVVRGLLVIIDELVVLVIMV